MPRKKIQITLDSIPPELMENFQSILIKEIDIIKKDTESDLIILELAFWRINHKLSKWKHVKGGKITGSQLKEKTKSAFDFLRPISDEYFKKNGKYPSQEKLEQELARKNLSTKIYSTLPEDDALIKPSTIRIFISAQRNEMNKHPSTNKVSEEL